MGVSMRHDSIVHRRVDLAIARLNRPHPHQAADRIDWRREPFTWASAPIPVRVRVSWSDGRTTWHTGRALGWNRRAVDVEITRGPEHGRRVCLWADQVTRL